MAIHIDTTFMPLAPGKVLVNPEYLDVDKLPSILNSWDLLIPPAPPAQDDPLSGVSHWAGINVLMLDEERVQIVAQFFDVSTNPDRARDKRAGHAECEIHFSGRSSASWKTALR